MTAPDRSPVSGEARVLVLLDQPLIYEMVRLTLNHGVYLTRDARDAPEAMTILAEWEPHLAVVDMDLGVEKLFEELSGDNGAGTRIPVVGLTRRGDLKTKLA